MSQANLDRRALLKKLAAGSAVAAGVWAAPTLIQTSTAFADQGSASCLPTNCGNLASFTLSVVGTVPTMNIVMATSTSAMAVCGPGFAASTQFMYRVTRLTGAGGGGGARVIDCGSGAILANNGVWTSPQIITSVCLTNMSTSSNLNNGTYRLDLAVRRVCKKPGTTCWCCAGVTQDFRLASSTLTLLTAQVPLPVPAGVCGTPAP